MAALLLTVAGAIVLGVVSNEIFAWLPRLAQTFVELAARRFRDPELGQRFLEEWKASIADIPGGLTAVIHAATIVACVRNVERTCAAEVTSSDVDERFTELGQTVRDFTDSFFLALTRRGLSLEDVARLTKVSIRDLKALMRGDLSKMLIGYQSVFAYMPDLSTMLGSDFPDIKVRYTDVLRKSGGLPPASVATVTERLMRLWCAVAGHHATKQYIHSCAEFRFHWSYRRCWRCGDVSVMRSQPCSGKKVWSKHDFYAPVSERFACETEDLGTYSSLNSPEPQWVIGERVKMTPDRLKAHANDDHNWGDWDERAE